MSALNANNALMKIRGLAKNPWARSAAAGVAAGLAYSGVSGDGHSMRDGMIGGALGVAGYSGYRNFPTGGKGRTAQRFQLMGRGMGRDAKSAWGYGKSQFMGAKSYLTDAYNEGKTTFMDAYNEARGRTAAAPAAANPAAGFRGPVGQYAAAHPGVGSAQRGLGFPLKPGYSFTGGSPLSMRPGGATQMGFGFKESHMAQMPLFGGQMGLF